jgi:hypothetical protein
MLCCDMDSDMDGWDMDTDWLMVEESVSVLRVLDRVGKVPVLEADISSVSEPESENEKERDLDFVKV